MDDVPSKGLAVHRRRQRADAVIRGVVEEVRLDPDVQRVAIKVPVLRSGGFGDVRLAGAAEKSRVERGLARDAASAPRPARARAHVSAASVTARSVQP